MFVSDKLIFIELHKTGCTHIVRLLSGLVEGEQIGKHNQLTEELLRRGIPIIGSIRNPWEWYLSLWAFGCDSKGAVYSALTRKVGWNLRNLGLRADPLGVLYRLRRNFSGRPEMWKRCYADVNDAGAFRAWLSMINDRAYWNDFKDGFGRSKASEAGGLYTYRFLKLFCVTAEQNHRLDAVRHPGDAHPFAARCCFVDHFVRNERLEQDLIGALSEIGIELSAKQRANVMAAGRTNASSRRKPASCYYDGETERLVRERDRLIVDRFGYRLEDGGTVGAAKQARVGATSSGSALPEGI